MLRRRSIRSASSQACRVTHCCSSTRARRSAFVAKSNRWIRLPDIFRALSTGPRASTSQPAAFSNQRTRYARNIRRCSEGARIRMSYITAARASPRATTFSRYKLPDYPQHGFIPARGASGSPIRIGPSPGQALRRPEVLGLEQADTRKLAIANAAVAGDRRPQRNATDAPFKRYCTRPCDIPRATPRQRDVRVKRPLLDSKIVLRERSGEVRLQF